MIIEIEKAGTFGGSRTEDVVITKSGSLNLESRDEELYPVSWKLKY